MKVTYNSVVADGVPSKHHVVNLNGVPCCDRMRKAVSSHAVGFGDDPEMPFVSRTGKPLYAMPQYIYRHTVCIYSADLDIDNDIDYHPIEISFCPFCGTKIEITTNGEMKFRTEKTEEITTKETLVPEKEV